MTSPSSAVIGHERILDFLRAVATPDAQGAYPRLRHAYLFTGAEALGKSTLAQRLAMALFCRRAQGDPCRECPACQAFRHGNHPDFLQVDPTDSQGRPRRRRGLLRAEQAEAIIHHTLLRPFQSPFRVILIRELHQAHPVFLNKLLKTFEEPPAAVVLLATAVNAARLLPTLVSRCQALPLRPLPTDLIHRALTQVFAMEEARAQLLARLAHGRIGWALSHAEDDRLEAARAQARSLASRLAFGSALTRLSAVHDLARRHPGDGRAVQTQVEFWSFWWRDVWLWQHGQEAACVNIDCLRDIQAAAQRTDAGSVTAFLARLEKAQAYLRQNGNVRLALTNAVLHMPAMAPAPSTKGQATS